MSKWFCGRIWCPLGVRSRVKWLGHMLDLLILKNLHTGFHNSYANVYSHQQRITVPIHTSSPTVLVRPFDDHHSDGGSPFPDNQGCETLRNTGTCDSFSRNCLFISLAQVLIESFIFLVFHICRIIVSWFCFCNFWRTAPCLDQSCQRFSPILWMACSSDGFFCWAGAFNCHIAQPDLKANSSASRVPFRNFFLDLHVEEHSLFVPQQLQCFCFK